MVAPLLARDQVIGMMAVWRFGAKPPFTQADLDFLVGLSQQAAAAIEGARLLEAQREAEMRFRRLAEELPLVTYIDAPFASPALGRAPLVGRNIYISPQCEAMLGYPPADWGDSTLWEADPPPGRPRTGAGRDAAFPGDRRAAEHRVPDAPPRRPRHLGARRVGDRARRERRSAIRAGLLDRHHGAQGARRGAAGPRGGGLSREAVLPGTRGSEPDRDRHHGSRRAGDVVEPGGGAAVRLEPRPRRSAARSTSSSSARPCSRRRARR